MTILLRLFLISLIFFRLDSLNYYNDINDNVVEKIDNDLDKVYKKYSHIIINSNYFYKNTVLIKNNMYNFKTKNLNIEGTFLGSNNNTLYIANNSYLFKVEEHNLRSVVKII